MGQSFETFTLICITLFGSFHWRIHGQNLHQPQQLWRPYKNLVGMTIVGDAAATGAVCLDGSLPAYHIQRGSESGADNWLLQFEGGGWCTNVESCFDRSTTHRGSTIYMKKFESFSGILSNNVSQNPDFYNWNRVKIRYCDGASFGGDSEYHNATTSLYFRGQRIWKAIINDLLPKGLGCAKKVLLSGCSAGGLATFLHCDDLAHTLQTTTTVKCLSDAGFFLDVDDISGNNTIRPFFKAVVSLQNVTNNLNTECLKFRNFSYECFFPQYALTNIKTPYFLLNSAYDKYQFNHIFVPPSADQENVWQHCKHTLTACTIDQISLLQGYRSKMLNAITSFEGSSSGGLYINSCFAHCQSEIQDIWCAPDSPRIQNKKLAEVVGDWYFDRKDAKEIDCPYPCDKTCHNLIPLVE